MEGLLTWIVGHGLGIRLRYVRDLVGYRLADINYDRCLQNFIQRRLRHMRCSLNWGLPLWESPTEGLQHVGAILGPSIHGKPIELSPSLYALRIGLLGSRSQFHVGYQQQSPVCATKPRISCLSKSACSRRPLRILDTSGQYPRSQQESQRISFRQRSQK